MGGAHLETETFIMPNLKVLLRPKYRLRLPLSGTISIPNVMICRSTIIEKYSGNAGQHKL